MMVIIICTEPKLFCVNYYQIVSIMHINFFLLLVCIALAAEKELTLLHSIAIIIVNVPFSPMFDLDNRLGGLVTP